MQIVIEIPDEIYERFGYEYREENLISKHMNDIILDAFCNGTSLPKGHGDLIDVNRKITVSTYDEQYEEWGEETNDGA